MTLATPCPREDLPPITRRQVEIDFGSVADGAWLPGMPALERLFDAASLSFPRTERFFISAVRDHEKRIEDPVLRQQVRDFVFQEAMHNKVHVSFNEIVRQRYARAGRAERVSLVTFRLLDRLPAWFRLSLASALEHYTSAVAETLLRHADDFRATVPPAVADMWLWHAAEETEHKSVCFDVHRAVLGNGLLAYLNRVTGMVVATIVFSLLMILLTAALLGPRAGRPATAAPAAPRKEKSSFGGGMLSVLWHGVPWRLCFSYYRPGFHPWDHDNSDLLQWWQRQYPGFGMGRRAASRP